MSQLKSVKYVNGQNSIGFLVSQKLTNEELSKIKEIGDALETDMIGSMDVKEEEITSTNKYDELYNTELVIAVGDVYESFVPMGVKIKNLGKPYVSISECGTRLDKFTPESYQVSLKDFFEEVLSIVKGHSKEVSKEAKKLADKYIDINKPMFVVDEKTVSVEVQKLIKEIAETAEKINKPHRGIITLKKGANAQGALDAGFNKSGEEILKKSKDGEIKALVVIGEEVENLDEVDLEYLAVMDMFKTETMEKSEVALPLVSLAESQGTMTRTDGTIQTLKRALKPKTGYSNMELLDSILEYLKPNRRAV